VSEWIEEPFELELPLGATVEDLLVEVQRLWPSNEVTWLADRDGHAISLNTPIQEVSEVMQGTTPNAEDDREEREEREEERLVSQEEGLEVLVSRPLTRDQQEALQGFLAGTRVPANHQRYLRGKKSRGKDAKEHPGVRRRGRGDDHQVPGCMGGGKPHPQGRRGPGERQPLPLPRAGQVAREEGRGPRIVQQLLGPGKHLLEKYFQTWPVNPHFLKNYKKKKKKKKKKNE